MECPLVKFMQDHKVLPHIANNLALSESSFELWSSNIDVERDITVRYAAACHLGPDSLLQSPCHLVPVKSSSGGLGLQQNPSASKLVIHVRCTTSKSYS